MAGNPEALAAYNKAVHDAQTVYEEAARAAWDEFRRATAPQRAAFDAAIAAADAEDARAHDWARRDAAVKAAQAAFDSATAEEQAKRDEAISAAVEATQPLRDAAVAAYRKAIGESDDDWLKWAYGE